MHPVTIRSQYYQQFDIDVSRAVPAEGAGGWKETPLTFDRDRMALVVMHAVDCRTPEELPWLYRSTEYLGRANVILRTVFEPLLAGVRSARMRVYHVVPDSAFCREFPGYQRAINLAGPQAPRARIEIDDPLMKALKQFKRDNVMPGAHNSGPSTGVRLGFPQQATPVGEEGVAETSQQLFALCQADGINHLVYCGFTINVCMVSSGGGMVDMARHGLMCSALRQAVTAIENKESARTEAHKEHALWQVATQRGFVFDVAEFVRAIE